MYNLSYSPSGLTSILMYFFSLYVISFKSMSSNWVNLFPIPIGGPPPHDGLFTSINSYSRIWILLKDTESSLSFDLLPLLLRLLVERDSSNVRTDKQLVLLLKIGSVVCFELSSLSISLLILFFHAVIEEMIEYYHRLPLT